MKSVNTLMDFEESLSEIQQIIYTNPTHHVDFLVKRHTLETIKGEKKFPCKRNVNVRLFIQLQIIPNIVARKRMLRLISHSDIITRV